MNFVWTKAITLICSLIFCLSAFNTNAMELQSPVQQKLSLPTPQTHFQNGKYFNYPGETQNHMVDSAKIYLSTLKNTTYYYSLGNQASKWIANDTIIQQSITPIITWLGHATFLIQIGNKNIITDPVFFDILFHKRTITINPNNLPKIDIILISHNHRDHTDEKSLRMIQKRDNPLCLVPSGCTKLFHSFGFTKIREFAWWHELTIDPLTLSFLPAFHWSSRNVIDTNKSLWGSWMINYNGFKIYFAGDSAYWTHFKAIENKFAPINVAIMPIGPNEPRKYLKHEHLSSEEAGQAFLDLKADMFIPMHWGTFRLGNDIFLEPIQRLTKWWQESIESLENKTLQILKFVGQVKLEPTNI